MRVRTVIELREGVKVGILVTPALYRIAVNKGVDIDKDADGNKLDPYTSYLRVLFCAAMNAWEVDAFDNPEMGEFPYKYAEFVDWFWEDKDRPAKMVSFIYEALTGKSFKDEVVEEVKKKKQLNQASSTTDR